MSWEKQDKALVAALGVLCKKQKRRFRSRDRLFLSFHRYYEKRTCNIIQTIAFEEDDLLLLPKYSQGHFYC